MVGVRVRVGRQIGIVASAFGHILGGYGNGYGYGKSQV